jgi:hypothetical protein
LRMTFKTRPHRYSFSLSPSSRARCRGCNLTVERGALRLVTYAFVRPGRATQLIRHARLNCIGKVLAEDVQRASKHGGLSVSSDVGKAGGEEACRILQSAADGQPTPAAEVEFLDSEPGQPSIVSMWRKGKFECGDGSL